MRNDTTSRARRAAAIALSAGLASALGTASAWAETVPPSTVHAPIVYAKYHQGVSSNGYDEWEIGDTVGTPGVASVSGGGGGLPFTTAATSSLPTGALSASATAVHNGSALNRAATESYVRDGFYLAEAATVTLGWTMTGQTSTTGFGYSDVDITVAIDCVYSENFCVPDRNGVVRGHRDYASGNGPSLSDTDSIALPLSAGWHRVEGIVVADPRASGPGGATANGELDFSITVPAGTRWASASGMLPVTGGTEIDDTPAPPPPPAPTPASELAELAASIQSAKASGAIRNERPLMSKVETAQAAVDAGNEQAAANALTALRNHLRAQSGKHVPAPLATGWSNDAAAIIAML